MLMNRAYLFFIMLCLACPILSNGQAKRACYVEISGSGGRILPHFAGMRYLNWPQQQMWTADLRWKLNKQDLPTHGFAGYTGATVSYVDFGYDKVLGQAWMAGMLAEPVIARHKAYTISYRISGGLALLNRVYNPQTNPENVFFSSPLSLWATARLQGSYQINPTWTIHGYAGFHHISNGATKRPNFGLNWMTAGLGISYRMRDAQEDTAQVSTALMALRVRSGWQTQVFFTDRPTNDWQMENFPVWGIAVQHAWAFRQTHAWTAGIEWTHNRSLVEDHLRIGTVMRTNGHQLGILGGHEYHLGRFVLGVHMGIYVLGRWELEDKLYQRYSLQYVCSKRVLLGLNLKAHRNAADFTDLRVGFRW